MTVGAPSNTIDAAYRLLTRAVGRPYSVRVIRPARRRFVVLFIVTAVLAVGAFYGVRLVTGPDCAVRLADGSTVGLSRVEAMSVTTVLAVGSRTGTAPAVIARAVANVRRVQADDRVSPSRAAELVFQPASPAGTESAAIVDALTARRPALSCDASRADTPEQRLGTNGLTPRAGRALASMRATFGDLPVGGFSPRGVTSGHIEGSAHYEGRAVDVFFRPVRDANRSRGWVLAQWAVAHADRLGVGTVIYDERIWSSRWPLDQWRTYRHPDGPTDDPVLLHRDHVHVEVLG